MHAKSKLRPFVEGMVGRALFDKEADNFDFESLLGQECLLNVVHDEKRQRLRQHRRGLPLPKGMDAPALVNETRMIDVNTATAEQIEALPEFIKSKILSSVEWQGRIKHAENMSAARANRPARVAAEMATERIAGVLTSYEATLSKARGTRRANKLSMRKLRARRKIENTVWTLEDGALRYLPQVGQIASAIRL
jgi:hypothetical protein